MNRINFIGSIEAVLRPPQSFLVDFEAKPKELTGRSRSVSKDFTEQMKLIYKSHYNTHILDVLARKFKIQL